MDKATISLGQVKILGKSFGFSFKPFAIASMILGWSEPRLTKQFSTPSSHSASKKAYDAVYLRRESINRETFKQSGRTHIVIGTLIAQANQARIDL